MVSVAVAAISAGLPGDLEASLEFSEARLTDLDTCWMAPATVSYCGTSVQQSPGCWNVDADLLGGGGQGREGVRDGLGIADLSLQELRVAEQAIRLGLDFPAGSEKTPPFP